MKLIAIKHISSVRPKGSVFEVSNRQGRILVAIKAATPYEDAVAVTVTTQPSAPSPAEPEPLAPAVDPEPAPVADPQPTPEPEPIPVPVPDAPKSAPRRGRNRPS